MIDSSRTVTKAVRYTLDTESPRAPERFRSMLFEKGGDDDGGVIRMDDAAPDPPVRQLLSTPTGPRSPRWRCRARSTTSPTGCTSGGITPTRRFARSRARTNCTNLDPRRADRLRHPVARLLGEYVLAYVTMIQRAPLSAADKRECYRHLVSWATSRAVPRSIRGEEDTAPSRMPSYRSRPPWPRPAGEHR